jgi:hypothetical protein
MDLVVPDAHPHRLLHRIDRQMQRQHAGRAKDDLVGLELGPDQRHARQLALAHEFPLRVHHHPGPVQVEPGLGQHRFVDRHAGTGLDRVDHEGGNGGGDVWIGLAHGQDLAGTGGWAAWRPQETRFCPASYNPPHGKHL